MFSQAIYDNPKYDQLINTKKCMRIWNFHENYFLLCKEYHQENPGFDDDRYFYAYIRYMRKNKNKIIERWNRR